MEVELLVHVDHPVALRTDAVADLLDRLNDQPDVRPRIERAAAAGVARSASCATGARQDAAVHTEHSIAGRHRPCRTFFQRHRCRLGRRHQSLGQP